MRTHISAALVALFFGTVGPAEACSYQESPTFKESLENATSVFIFRLDQAQHKQENHGPKAYSVWAEGKITIVQNLYGNPASLRNIKFSTSWCGGVTLVVGRHYLIATSASGDTIELVSDDRSLYDIEGLYNPLDKKRSLRSALILPVIQSIYDIKPLPQDFPPSVIERRTVLLPPAPPET